MGFVIWYQVVFSAGGPGGVLPLVVPNDVFAGQYALDADITVDMVAGAVAGSFVIKLTDLPETVAATLVTVQHDRQLSDPVTVRISLGYFDDPASQVKPVLTGVIRSIRSSVDDTGHLVTEVSGLEIAGYRGRRSTWVKSSRMRAAATGNTWPACTTVRLRPPMSSSPASRWTFPASRCSMTSRSSPRSRGTNAAWWFRCIPACEPSSRITGPWSMTPSWPASSGPSSPATLRRTTSRVTGGYACRLLWARTACRPAKA